MVRRAPLPLVAHRATKLLDRVRGHEKVAARMSSKLRRNARGGVVVAIDAHVACRTAVDLLDVDVPLVLHPVGDDLSDLKRADERLDEVARIERGIRREIGLVVTKLRIDQPSPGLGHRALASLVGRFLAVARLRAPGPPAEGGGETSPKVQRSPICKAPPELCVSSP